MPLKTVAPKTIAGKRFAVYGFGATGQAIARFLLDRRGVVTVLDDAPEQQFDPALLDPFRQRGIEFQFQPTGHDWMRLLSGV
ncbi:MAG TPA: hypothetical protein VEI97_04760, partial [bacterium]|nr:hypothetical protein [bacterium]